MHLTVLVLVLCDLDKHFVIHIMLNQMQRDLQLVALDPLARHSMKTVAKCDKWCDMQVQNLYVNHRIVERTASSLTQERYAPLSVIMSSRLVVFFTEATCPGSGFTAFGSRFLRCIGCAGASGDLVMNVEVCQRAPCREIRRPAGGSDCAFGRNFYT